MNSMKTLILAAAVAAAMIAGCANKNVKATAGARKPQTAAVATTRPTDAKTQATAAPAPAVPSGRLAGEWSLAIPRRGQQQAKITVKDDNHVTIQAGENLGGEFVIQGNYLLILTRDERLRPLAYRINSPDSLTVVRSSDLGSDYTGATLVRAPSAETDTAAEAHEDEDQAAAGADELLD